MNESIEQRQVEYYNRLNDEQKRLYDLISDKYDISLDIVNGEFEAEINCYTNHDINMVFYINPFTLAEIDSYFDNFDIDNEVQLMYESSSFRERFSLREAIAEYEDWIEEWEDNISEWREALKNPSENKSGEFAVEDGVTYEVCPHCEEEVMLSNELKVQRCPSCGKYIVTCSMCPNNDGSISFECDKCPLSVLAKRMNESEDNRSEFRFDGKTYICREVWHDTAKRMVMIAPNSLNTEFNRLNWNAEATRADENFYAYVDDRLLERATNQELEDYVNKYID